jgi:hypothetical protein
VPVGSNVGIEEDDWRLGLIGLCWMQTDDEPGVWQQQLTALALPKPWIESMHREFGQIYGPEPTRFTKYLDSINSLLNGDLPEDLIVRLAKLDFKTSNPMRELAVRIELARRQVREIVHLETNSFAETLSPARSFIQGMGRQSKIHKYAEEREREAILKDLFRLD